MEKGKDILERFLKRKRYYNLFCIRIREIYGLSFDEFCSRIEDPNEMELAIAVLARDDTAEYFRNKWQILEQQWADYYKLAYAGIQLN